MLIKRGYTLIEILVVIVIIGILASLAWPNYSKLQEKALDREAKTSLALIRAAERIYKMEVGYYYPMVGSESVVWSINADLKLSLPTDAIKWTYQVDSTGKAQATRSGRTWELESSGASENPSCSPAGACL